MAKAPTPAKRVLAKPRRPANVAHGRWLGDFAPLSAVEKRLIDHCAHGTQLFIAGEKPPISTPENTIRADIVRFLLLGGDSEHPVHEEGVMIQGAWIADELNLHQATCKIRLDARSCHFASAILATAASIPELGFSGSTMPQLEGDRLKVKGGIFLSNKFAATGEIRLLGAEVGGNLECIDGRFSNERGYAINADGIKVKGGVFLSDGFAAIGEVRLLGAEIGGNLTCSGGTFLNSSSYALNIDGAIIKDGLFLRSAKFFGIVDLTTVYTCTLIEGRVGHEQATFLLDGFRYDRIIGPTDAAGRIAWLERQRISHLGADFRPQPWEQLIKTLREMGHLGEAAEIAMAKQQMLRKAGKIGTRSPNTAFTGIRLWLDKIWSGVSNLSARWFHDFYGWVAGYGHRPQRIFWRMVLVCALCSVAYYGGRHYGLIGPTNPLIHHSAELRHCGTGGDTNVVYWTSPACPVPPEYSTFQPFFYSLDVILPLIDLHQEADWAPVVTNSAGEPLWAGRLLRGLMWFEILFGWLASLMFVAIVGRLVEKD